MIDKAATVGGLCPPGDVVVVAHSLGAVAVALAFAAGDVPASHVVLLEPALYDIARGHHAVEGHIGAITDARDRAARDDLFGYWEIVGPLMFGRHASRETWAVDREVSAHLASLEPPWGHGIDASVFADVPTLVVTGGWNDEYEAIASRLANEGAEHVRLPGTGHRPQDHPGFEAAVTAFLRTSG
jgi:pimeloyl-ACP methyl ester carboxylesterase